MWQQVFIQISGRTSPLFHFPPQSSTTFEDFATIVCEDKRSATLDAGNVKLTYNALLEKAETREKERLKEEGKKMRKLENGFRAMLQGCQEPLIGEDSKWEDFRERFEKEPAFVAVEQEYERMRIFNVSYLEIHKFKLRLSNFFPGNDCV